MKRALALALSFAAAGAASADDVMLRGGGKVSGLVVDRTPTSLVVEVGPGRVTLPLSRVERVVESRTALGAFRERAAQLSPDDLAGWLELGRWARERDLPTQAREAFARALARDPQNAEANEAIGNVRLADRWVSEDESYRARGYVRFDGNWVTPEERLARIRAEAEETAARRATAEAEARVREAEARAEAAEAEARRARAEADDASDSGIYLPPVVGGAVCPPYCSGAGVRPPRPSPDPTPSPDPHKRHRDPSRGRHNPLRR
jgi:hypothetical protein